MVLFWILTSTFLVSLVSLVGIFTLTIKGNLLQKLLFCLVGFSAGALIGSAFLHILPESLEHNPSSAVFSCLILGIVIFFIMERVLHWRHCHEEGNCKTHAFTYLTLVGDGCHNFIDGLVIAASFMVSLPLGATTTLAVILHEIPQELSDFAILVYGGFSKQKALLCNFASALLAVAGALCGYFINQHIRGFQDFILPLTAGGFIYIATSDLIPELHKERSLKRSMAAFIAFLSGIMFMALAKKFLPV
jgi:zinc and cadmium transporter